MENGMIPAEMTANDSLIVVKQLPIITEQLHTIKAQAEMDVAEALALACTEETLKVVKERRAALNRQRKDLDARRMLVKNQIMKPFEEFDRVYKECVTDVYSPADKLLAAKIAEVESGLKAEKESKVIAYFNELVQVNSVAWIEYEDVGITVTQTASLKSLKTKVKDYVDRIVADVTCIGTMENAAEIMAEYKQCRNLAIALNSVRQRKDAVAREEEERRRSLEAKLREQEAVDEVLSAAEEELMQPEVLEEEPEVVPPEDEIEEVQRASDERIMTAQFGFMGREFRVRATLNQLRELKAFVNDKIEEICVYMNENGIENQEVSNNE